jgi:DNA-binding CsgD family transcriptional regulator
MDAMEGSKLFLMTNPDVSNPQVAHAGNYRRDKMKPLTSRERQIALLVCTGLSNKQIARPLDVTQGTVKVHLHNIYRKFAIHNRTMLALLALKLGVTVLCAASVFPGAHATVAQQPDGAYHCVRRFGCSESEGPRDFEVPAGLVLQAFGWKIGIPALDNTRVSNTERGDPTGPPALAEAVRQNTRRYGKEKPAGVPRSWSWYNGKNGAISASAAPPGFSAMTGWAIVYPIDGLPNTNSHIVIRNFASYVRLTSGQWVKVQDQATMPMEGSHFHADFSGTSIPLLINEILPDNSWQIDSPPPAYNDHFWPKARGRFTPGTVDGVFVEMDIRMDSPDAYLIAAAGADYWIDGPSGTTGPGDSPTNRGIGTGNFTKLTTRWQTLYYYSLSRQQLEANPPPPLATPPETTPGGGL